MYTYTHIKKYNIDKHSIRQTNIFYVWTINTNAQVSAAIILYVCRERQQMQMSFMRDKQQNN